MSSVFELRPETQTPGDILRTNGVEILNPGGSAPILLACDHAGNQIPPHLNDLGIPYEERQRHVGWDIGAADVTRALSQALDAPAIFQHVSRLVIDVNRAPGHPASIPEQSDDVVIPGNKALSAGQKRKRERFFWDYHVNTEALLARMRVDGKNPVILFVHSFTELLRIHGEERPWHMGILHGHDRTLSDILYDELTTAHPELLIGDDVPYSGVASGAYSHVMHAEAAGIPFAILEIRQDLIQTREGALDWAERLRSPFMRSMVRLEPKLSDKKTPEQTAFGAEIRKRRIGDPHIFTMGLEEEYFIVRKDTGQAEPNPPREVFERLQKLPAEQGMVTPEFFRFQIEIGTSVKKSVKGLREETVALRGLISETLREYDLELVASASHPTAQPSEQLVTPEARYEGLWRLQAYPVRRLLTCGMHVHAGIPDLGMRNDLFGQIRHFLPYFLAPSTSSPFWCGKKTDFMCYRLPVFHELKNTGLPPVFSSYQSYLDYVENAVKLGIVTDPTMFWWDVRPNWNNPTLETRVSDVCTNVNDGVAIAALCLCTYSMLARQREAGQGWRIYDDGLIESNIWDARRDATDCTMVDIMRHKRMPFADMFEDLVSLIEPDIDAYDCGDEINHIRTIMERGTSAHNQVRIYEESKNSGASHDEALTKVLRWLMEETVRF